MKTIIACTALVLLFLATSCEVQSEMTKKSVEKYNPSPTPVIERPTPDPIDPADVVTADTSQTGPLISIVKSEEKKPANCDKFNRVTVNGDDKTVTINGVCKQLTINGDRNKITIAATSEIVINGTENTVNYLKITNGKRPFVTENATPNTISKIASTGNGPGNSQSPKKDTGK